MQIDYGRTIDSICQEFSEHEDFASEMSYCLHFKTFVPFSELGWKLNGSIAWPFPINHSTQFSSSELQ